MSYFLTDFAGSLHPASDVSCREDTNRTDEPLIDGDETIDFDEAETVTIEDDGITEFFGTDEFYRFETTVAKPLTQRYVVDDEIVRLKKTEEELKKSVWQIDTLPWTKTHPSSKEVEDTSQIHGFWRSPTYEDGQTAVGYIPANDEEMQSFVAENPSVSIGFTPQIEWTVDSNVPYEGVQREMVYDHIASVREGRCSIEDGCGIHQAMDSGVEAYNHITPLDEAAEARLSSIADDGAAATTTNLDTTMCDDNPFDGVVDGMSVEAVRRRNDSVDEELSALDEEIEELNDDVDELETTVDEKDERIGELESTVDEKDERITALEEEVLTHVDAAFEEAVEELTSMADKWSEDDLTEQYEAAEGVSAKKAVVDDVAEKIDLVEDLSTTVTTVGDSGVDDDGNGVDDEGDVVDTVADAKTDDGTFDLRGDA